MGLLRGFSFPKNLLREFIAVTCAAALTPVGGGLNARPIQQTAAPAAPVAQEAPKISADQLDSLVAPIALYPDPLLSQTLVASTYPLEIVKLQQWLEKHKGLKDKALAEAVSKQPWDPSIQAMAGLPDLVKRLANDIQWITDLGNAFLAQQADVMDAVQRMRKKAQESGNLKATQQQKVETKVVDNKTVIIVEQSNPEVIYVPSYNPTVVYGDPIYPYPPIYYPPAGYYAAGAAISFGIGIAVGAALGGGWGWGCGWGGNEININRNNNFNRNTNIGSIGNRTNVSGNRGASNWQHNPKHRGGAPYSDRATANRFGGTARGDSLSNRQAGARQQINQQGGKLGGRGGGEIGAGSRVGAGDRGGVGGGGDRVGSRDVPRSSQGRDRSAFGGGDSGNFSGRGARASGSRGSSSMGSMGGMRGGGGSRGGGRRR
jgi:hypothetical protein